MSDRQAAQDITAKLWAMANELRGNMDAVKGSLKM